MHACLQKRAAPSSPAASQRSLAGNAADSRQVGQLCSILSKAACLLYDWQHHCTLISLVSEPFGVEWR